MIINTPVSLGELVDKISILHIKNININDLQDKISIISNPLTDDIQFADFKLSSTDEGGALSSFGVEFDQNGNVFEGAFSYKTLGYTLDFYLSKEFLLRCPLW